MNQLPLWPPIAAILFGVIALGILKYWSRRLDRDEEDARRKGHPAE